MPRKLSSIAADWWDYTTMDEWFLDDKEAPPTHPLSFEKADRELCFNRIRKDLVMPAHMLAKKFRMRPSRCCYWLTTRTCSSIFIATA